MIFHIVCYFLVVLIERLAGGHNPQPVHVHGDRAVARVLRPGNGPQSLWSTERRYQSSLSRHLYILLIKPGQTEATKVLSILPKSFHSRRVYIWLIDRISPAWGDSPRIVGWSVGTDFFNLCVGLLSQSVRVLVLVNVQVTRHGRAACGALWEEPNRYVPPYTDMKLTARIHTLV